MKRVCLFCGSNVGKRPAYAQAAADLGRALAARSVALVYGGGSVGLMKIAAEAALAESALIAETGQRNDGKDADDDQDHDQLDQGETCL